MILPHLSISKEVASLLSRSSTSNPYKFGQIQFKYGTISISNRKAPSQTISYDLMHAVKGTNRETYLDRKDVKFTDPLKTPFKTFSDLAKSGGKMY